MPNALITGGLGFIGSNLSARLLGEDWSVTVLDNFSRRGAEDNARWLAEQAAPGQLTVTCGDVRDAALVARALADADVVFHLAGQVSAVASIRDPRADFEVNALGTFNVLEAARQRQPGPVVIFTSTNKVYGSLDDMAAIQLPKRWAYANGRRGIAETQPLDFYSPYGCSRGAAEQYVRDYARIYGLRTVVFRMSAIYGPHQFATDDQGWVAFFCIQSVFKRPVGLYGVGKQVRDVLYVDDLIRAFLTACSRAGEVSGEIFNIGGGCENTLSIQELFDLLKARHGRRVQWSTVGHRAGDQKIYVSDIAKAQRQLDWSLTVSVPEGVNRLCAWIEANRELFEDKA